MVWDKIIYWGSEYGGALQACLISAPILFLHASSHKLDKSSTLMVLFCLYHVHRKGTFPVLRNWTLEDEKPWNAAQMSLYK